MPSCLHIAPIGGAIAVAVFLVIAAGCAGIDRAEVPPDERYGHRFVQDELEEQELLEPEEAPDGRYFLYDIPIRDVTIRKGAEAADRDIVEDTLEVATGVPVDLLIEGALPDPCLKLHDISQSKTGRFIDVEIKIRRLQGETCRPMRRPYRLYVELDEQLQPGSYMLRINGEPYPLEIRED